MLQKWCCILPKHELNSTCSLMVGNWNVAHIPHSIFSLVPLPPFPFWSEQYVTHCPIAMVQQYIQKTVPSTTTTTDSPSFASFKAISATKISASPSLCCTITWCHLSSLVCSLMNLHLLDIFLKNESITDFDPAGTFAQTETLLVKWPRSLTFRIIPSLNNAVVTAANS